MNIDLIPVHCKFVRVNGSGSSYGIMVHNDVQILTAGMFSPSKKTGLLKYRKYKHPTQLGTPTAVPFHLILIAIYVYSQGS
jgi:hypothetical protein